jgi:predicted MPP superfamily phosphohydrolase
VFHLLLAAIFLYVVWRLVLPLHLPASRKWCLVALLLICAEHQVVTRTFFGSMASPEIPYGLLLILGFASGSLILLAMLLLCRDLIGVVLCLFTKRIGRRLLHAKTLAVWLVPVAMVLSFVGVWQAVRIPAVKTVEISLPQLPKSLDGFRIVQLTDLHASRLFTATWMTTVVDRVNALKPDVVVITGDLADGTPMARSEDILPLTALHAKYGVFAIPGNHEYYTDYLAWLARFEEIGLPMLLNRHVTIQHNDAALVIAGVTDVVAKKWDLPPPDLAAALKGVDPDALVVLLDHRPTEAKHNAQAGVALQLSGHTHGGQILGPHFLAQLLNNGFVSGLYDVGPMQLYVSNGTGLWPGFPIRLGRPSEVTQIILRATQS